MKTMKLLLVLAFIGLFGCSLQNVNLKPQMNAKNLKADMGKCLEKFKTSRSKTIAQQLLHLTQFKLRQVKFPANRLENKGFLNYRFTPE